MVSFFPQAVQFLICGMTLAMGVLVPTIAGSQSSPAPTTELGVPAGADATAIPDQRSDQRPDQGMDAKYRVDRFDVTGSTIFKPEAFAAATAAFTGRELTFAEVLQARAAITKLYTDQGYLTTGAIVVPQAVENGVMQIQVLEGKLEDIKITGNRRLSTRYIRDRIQQGAGTPLNVPYLLQNLQVLRLDPRIASLAADLQAGVRPGTNFLQVDVTEADTLSTSVTLDNGRSPSVGSFRRRAQLTEMNLLGQGDTLSVGYSNTAGSNGVDVSYTLPLNAKDGSLWFSYSGSSSRVIEKPFTALDIQAGSRAYEIGFRQPLVHTPTREFAVGLMFSRQDSQTELGLDNIGPFPLSPGADAQGRTKISALRFFQEYSQRSEKHVFALRSQFSLGLDFLNSTVNATAPDSQFLSWRGQAQWLRQFAPDTLLLVKGDVQLTGNELVPLEQFGLGGPLSVRGYRQDALLSDRGALLSAELRLPILRAKQPAGVLQLTPFLDIGTAWNVKGQNPSPNTLVGAGVGLLWKQKNVSVRLDWGIPLVRVAGERRSLQDNGLYFSVNFTPF
jgi:hemolysin activation/secretion protein